MKYYIFKFFFLFIAFKALGQPVNKTMLRLPDTGATTSYTNTFGEDNDYTIFPPFFILNGNGTVTDTVTSLMWQQTDGGEMTIENAMIYCDTLTLDGYSDWRLPDAHESFSILNHQHVNPALDNAVFTTTTAEYWWTSIRQVNDSSKVWVTNAGGGIGNHPKTETISAGGTKKFHVRAVRDVNMPTTILNHFTDNGNGTITDNLTNLIWQKTPYADTITWEQALTYADTLTLANNNDWRLPNIKELQSINDESRINPSINNNLFNVASAKKYWSSTTLPNQTTKAWYLDTQFGITTYDLKTIRHNLICVRGNTNSTSGINTVANTTSNIFTYPNPFNNESKIIFSNDNSQHVYLNIYNQSGQLIRNLINGSNIAAGKYEIIWDGKDSRGSSLPNGIYYVTILAENKINKTQKIILNK